MIRRVAAILILASLLLALTTMSALARKSPEKARVSHEAISRVIEYSMPDEHDFIRGAGSTETTVGAPLYSDRSGPGHAGEEMGVSFYEYQHNSSMHRQIARGSDGSGGANDHTIHFEWMYLASEVLQDRSPNYAYYDAVAGSKSAAVDPTPPGDYGGYVSMDVTPDNRAVISAHNNQGAGYEIQLWWQISPNFPFFQNTSRIPRTVTNVGNTGGTGPDGEVVWPAMTYQVMPSGDQVSHVIGNAFGGGGSGGSSLHYIRSVNAEADVAGGGLATWVQGWMDPSGWRDVLDTIHSGEGYDIASNNAGRVAIVWVNNLPDPAEPCAGGDTCSNNNSLGGGRDRWDNDLYLQTSDDYGVTWNTRQNITKKVAGADGFRPFSDLSSMFTSDGVYHVAYVAMKWEEANQGLYASRVHHWSEALGYPDGGGVDQGPYAGLPGNIRTVGVADWDPQNCTPGAFNENAAKLSIAECDNKLYVMWVELNSPKTTGNTAQDDCAARAWSGQRGGAANGDLLVAVSNSAPLGLTWDASRSITDSYGGANGDPAGAGACNGDVIGGNTPCPAEHWPSMTEQGSAKTINMAEITSPSLVLNNLDPGWAGTNYLDISYMDDPDPGGAIMGQGTWQSAQVRWIRIPCVEPVPAPGFAMNPNSFKFPKWVKNCVQKDVDVLIENTGNVALTYTPTVIEDPGPATGWLTISNFSGSVPSGLGNKETGQVHLNTGGTICGGPGSITKVTGRVEFNHNATRTINNFEIELYVADTVIPVGYDTISTTCFALTVGNNGNAGNQGQGGVNLDYEALDWKTGQDAYLYDGGTVVGDLRNGGTDTVVNWGLFQVGIADSLSLIPVDSTHSKTTLSWAEMYNTGVYVTNDTSIAMVSEFYAPSDADSCNIIIKRTMVYSNDGASHVVTVGEVADYDIPNDSNNSYNTSGDGSDPVFAATGAQLVFLQGVDQFPDTAQDTTAGSWFAAERYGVLQYLGGQLITGGVTTEAYPTANVMYTASNPRWVYPYDLGFDPDSLYKLMGFTGSSVSDSTGDLHVGCSYVFEQNLASTDTMVFYVAYITNLNASYPYASKASSGIAGSVIKAGALYTNHFEIPFTGCCVTPGDFNGDGAVNISDLSGPTSMVQNFFLSGPAPPCPAEGDFNGDGAINISDLSGPTSMVQNFFLSGPAPVCGPEK